VLCINKSLSHGWKWLNLLHQWCRTWLIVLPIWYLGQWMWFLVIWKCCLHLIYLLPFKTSYICQNIKISRQITIYRRSVIDCWGKMAFIYLITYRPQINTLPRLHLQVWSEVRQVDFLTFSSDRASDIFSFNRY